MDLTTTGRATATDTTAATKPAKPGKVKAGVIVKKVLRRVANPVHLARAAKLQWKHKSAPRVRDDAQLRLYAQVLPGGFLHYGYFDDVDRRPEDMSLSEITRAQERYAEILLEQVVDHESPVLDVGCGMGGLCRMLRERGLAPVALTPDRTQAMYVRGTYAGLEVHECKLEDFAAAPHDGRFGTVVTSESLQYLKLDRALPVIQRVLKPGGRWVACDYFRLDGTRGRSGHDWAQFADALRTRGWRVTLERDITPNILPTLRCVHMWATRLGVPLLELVVHRLRRKRPGLHYLLEDTLETVREVARENIDIVNPETFARQKKYLLLVMERGA
jgi:cyclopropane fatty-acyl-phospholipid synthase-like methyltransferase